MPMPTPAQMEPYDLVIWQDDGLPTICAGTREGVEFMQQFIPCFERGDQTVLLMPPEIFLAEMPRSIRLGIQDPLRNIVVPHARALLH